MDSAWYPLLLWRVRLVARHCHVDSNMSVVRSEINGSSPDQLQELQVSLVLAFLGVSEDSSECCDGSDWLSIRRSVMSKLGDLWSLLTAFPSVPLAPSLLLRPSLECSALDTLDCISINSSVIGPAHWRKVYPYYLLFDRPPPTTSGGRVGGWSLLRSMPLHRSSLVSTATRFLSYL